jgi:hypothetical protein
MAHLGNKIDVIDARTLADHERLNTLVIRQKIIWSVAGVIGTGVILAIIQNWPGQ